ncbi:MAG: ABATE domain-containing protein, partial [Trebonia sp.]
MSAPTGVAGEDASSAVALVNTRHLQSGQPADLLADPARAAGWLAERGLLPRGTALPDPDTARLVALREAVRGLFAARAGQRVPAVDDVTLLNAALAAAPVVPALTWDEAGPHSLERALAGDGPGTVAIARLARDALRVLTDPTG